MQINSLKFNLGVSCVNTPQNGGGVNGSRCVLRRNGWLAIFPKMDIVPKFNSKHLVNFVKKSKLKSGWEPTLAKSEDEDEVGSRLVDAEVDHIAVFVKFALCIRHVERAKEKTLNVSNFSISLQLSFLRFLLPTSLLLRQDKLPSSKRKLMSLEKFAVNLAEEWFNFRVAKFQVGCLFFGEWFGCIVGVQ